jgi:hypothetical protein
MEKGDNAMSESNNNNNECLRDDWKDVGKGMGKTFAGLGKTLVKTAKIGATKIDDWAEDKDTDTSAQKASMKEGWKEFGRDFVNTAEDLGKASVKSVKKGVDAVDSEDGTEPEMKSCGEDPDPV